MKLSIERATLLKALAHVQSVVERRTTIPILSNVKLDAEQGGISLTATDMDLLVIEQVEAEVSQPAAATAPAHTLYDVVRKLPEGSLVAIEQAKGGPELNLRAGRSTFDLPCLPAADFPSMTDEGLSHSFALAAAELCRLFDRTKFAAQGAAGGGEGEMGEFVLSTGERPNPKQLITVPPEVTVNVTIPGGGGYFPAQERDPQHVLDDVVNGYVTLEGAEQDYGVKITCSARPGERVVKNR